MKTFEICYTYNYRPELCKIFKAPDGLEALDAAEAWIDETSTTINAVKIQEIHLGHFSKEGRVSHSYGDILFDWKFKSKIAVKTAIENSKQKWMDALNKKYKEK